MEFRFSFAFFSLKSSSLVSFSSCFGFWLQFLRNESVFLFRCETGVLILLML